MSNVLTEEKRNQVVALGRLGWSLRRIQEATGVRRETVAVYLKAAGLEVRKPGGWGKQPQPDSKPAIGVTTDSESPPAPKPAIEVTTDSEPPTNTSASACEPYREVIEEGLAKGRNAMSIWQQLVDTCSFSGAYESVKRFVRKQRGGHSPDACAVIVTAPGEDYGKCRVMVRGGGDAHFSQAIAAAIWLTLYISRYRASSHLMRLEDNCGAGAAVAWGPLAEPSALRFISRSA